jgi:hypothetical protein
MYQLRLVVDANCLNAKGKLLAMNELQLYHEAGAIELIVTSTLAAEVDRESSQAAKARTYQSVGVACPPFKENLACNQGQERPFADLNWSYSTRDSSRIPCVATR